MLTKFPFPLPRFISKENKFTFFYLTWEHIFPQKHSRQLNASRWIGIGRKCKLLFCCCHTWAVFQNFVVKKTFRCLSFKQSYGLICRSVWVFGGFSFDKTNTPHKDSMRYEKNLSWFLWVAVFIILSVDNVMEGEKTILYWKWRLLWNVLAL